MQLDKTQENFVLWTSSWRTRFNSYTVMGTEQLDMS